MEKVCLDIPPTEVEKNQKNEHGGAAPATFLIKACLNVGGRQIKVSRLVDIISFLLNVSWRHMIVSMKLSNNKK